MLNKQKSSDARHQHRCFRFHLEGQERRREEEISQKVPAPNVC